MITITGMSYRIIIKTARVIKWNDRSVTVAAPIVEYNLFPQPLLGCDHKMLFVVFLFHLKP